MDSNNEGFVLRKYFIDGIMKRSNKQFLLFNLLYKL